MRANSHSWLSLSVLTLSVGLGFVLPADAGEPSGRRRSSKQSRKPESIKMQDGLHIQMELVEIPSTMLTTTTDVSPGSEHLIQAVRAATKVGTARVKYTFESPMVVGRNLRMNVGLKEPFTRSGPSSKKGRVFRRTEYEDVGCSVNIETKRLGDAHDDGIFLQARLEWSDLKRKSGVLVSEDIEAPVFIEQSCQFATTMKPSGTFAFRMGTKRSERPDAWTTVIVTSVSENKSAS